MVKLSNNYRKKIGKVGENLATQWLLENGFTVLNRNVLTWGGEIDIVAIKEDILHIVEVKTTRSAINPLEHMGFKKLKTLQRAGERYVRFQVKQEIPFVISVCAVWLNSDETLKRIEFLENVEMYN
jgi:putative endonuclease